MGSPPGCRLTPGISRTGRDVAARCAAEAGRALCPAAAGATVLALASATRTRWHVNPPQGGRCAEAHSGLPPEEPCCEVDVQVGIFPCLFGHLGGQFDIIYDCTFLRNPAIFIASHGLPHAGFIAWWQLVTPILLGPVGTSGPPYTINEDLVRSLLERMGSDASKEVPAQQLARGQMSGRPQRVGGASRHRLSQGQGPCDTAL